VTPSPLLRDLALLDASPNGDGPMIDVEQLVRDEWKPGVSAGAAARQLAASLRCADRTSPLAALLEDMLASSNRCGHKVIRARTALRWLLHAIGDRPCAGHDPTMAEALAAADKALALDDRT
jgi:hypothetical protein